jgi:hypothetical protein
MRRISWTTALAMTGCLLAGGVARPADEPASPPAASPPAASPPAANPPAAKESAKTAAGPKHGLRYKFISGEIVRTEVTHTSSIQTTIKSTQESATSSATSVKVWKVLEVDAAGRAKLEQSVEWVRMSGRIDDQAEVIYDSRKDTVVPLIYKGVAETIGVPLAVVTLDPRGKVLRREQQLARSQANVTGNEVTIPLPGQSVAVGETWDAPLVFPVILDGGESKKINARQRYKLDGVSGDVAKISVRTQVLDPALSSKIEVQLLQRLTNGEVHFDLARGRITYQRMVVDGTSINFHGQGSLMKCKLELVEKLLDGNPRTAAKTPAKAK